MSRIKTLKGGSGGRGLIRSQARPRTRYGTGGGTTRQFTRQRSVWQSNCTEPAAVNYNPNATEDDGSCEFPEFKWIMGVVMDRDSTENIASLCDLMEPLSDGVCWYGYANGIGFSPLATEDDPNIGNSPSYCCNHHSEWDQNHCMAEGYPHIIRCYPNVYDDIYPGFRPGCSVFGCHGEMIPYDDDDFKIEFFHMWWFDYVAHLEHPDGLGLYRDHVAHSSFMAPPPPGYSLEYNAIVATTGNATGIQYWQWWWPYEPGVERETTIQIQHALPQWSFFYGGTDMYIDVTPHHGNEINDWDDIERWFESIRLTDAFGGQIFDIDLMDREDANQVWGSVFIDDMHTTVILKTVLKDISVQRIGIPAGDRDNVS